MSPKRTAVLDTPPENQLDVAGLGSPLSPQVNLLPPEVRSKRALGRTKIRLAIAFCVVILIAVLAFAYSVMEELGARGRLADVQERIGVVQADQAKYAEVPLLKGQIEKVDTARQFGMSTEILWSDYLRAIQAIAPEPVTIATLTTSTTSPIQAAVASADPLSSASAIGTLSFTGKATTLPDTAAWIDALETIPGFSDASFSSAAVDELDGIAYFEITSTVQVDAGAFSRRFVDEEAGQ